MAESFEGLHAALRHTNERVRELEIEVFRQINSLAKLLSALELERAPRPAPQPASEPRRAPGFGGCVYQGCEKNALAWRDWCAEHMPKPAPSPQPAREAQGEPLSCPHCAKPLPPYSLIREREAHSKCGDCGQRHDADYFCDEAHRRAAAAVDIMHGRIQVPEREAQGEPPTIEEITSLVHGGEVSTHEAWARCPECRPRAEKIRSLCLSHRAPSPPPVKVNMREHANGVEVIEVLSDGSERSVVVVPLDCWKPSPALAAMVEAAERWAGSDGCDLIEMHRAGKLNDSGYSDNVKRLVPLIVEARAALPQEKPQ